MLPYTQLGKDASKAGTPRGINFEVLGPVLELFYAFSVIKVLLSRFVGQGILSDGILSLTQMFEKSDEFFPCLSIYDFPEILSPQGCSRTHIHNH